MGMAEATGTVVATAMALVTTVAVATMHPRCGRLLIIVRGLSSAAGEATTVMVATTAVVGVASGVAPAAGAVAGAVGAKMLIHSFAAYVNCLNPIFSVSHS